MGRVPNARVIRVNFLKRISPAATLVLKFVLMEYENFLFKDLKLKSINKIYFNGENNSLNVLKNAF
jgi:hypothetical protein